MDIKKQPIQTTQSATPRDLEYDTPKSIPTPAHPTPTSMPRRLTILILVLILGVLIFGVLKSLKGSKSSKQADDRKVAQVSGMPTSLKVTTALNSLDGIINQVTEAIRKDSELASFINSNPEFNNFVWTETDGFNIYVEKTNGINIQIPQPDSALPSAPPPIEPLKSNASRKFHQIVANVMKSNDFQVSTNNSSSSIDDKSYYNYTQSYEGKGIRCVVSTEHDLFGSEATQMKTVMGMSISCVDDADFKTAHDKQVPFLMGLNDKTAVVSSIRVKNNLAHMNVSQKGAMGGAGGFMYHVGNDWKKALIAQAVPMCDELVKNNVPQEFWVDCYDTADHSQIRKGNPGWNF